MAEEKQTQGRGASSVRVRILRDVWDAGVTLYPCNSVQELSAAKARELVKAGHADDNPAAVEAALSFR